jgi:hypothetical protein
METVDCSISFTLRGVDGKARIRYEQNVDPTVWGFDQLGLDWDWSVAHGFPVIEARVEYPAKGYLGILGWIQVVDYTVRKESGTEDVVVAPDVAPQVRDANTPYMSFGIEPRLFDAPAFDEKDVDWTARAFLTYTPDLLMTPTVEPLCGCSWGYTINEGVVSPKDLELCTTEDWLHARQRLSARLPTWTFRGDRWQPPVFDT